MKQFLLVSETNQNFPRLDVPVLRMIYERPDTRPDPRDPDYSREGIFIHHNCWRCQHGRMPCVQGAPNRCEYPHARND